MAAIKAQITITQMDDGKISINGPIADKVLSYGLLEFAKDLIKEFHEKQQQRPSIVPPTDAERGIISRSNGREM